MIDAARVARGNQFLFVHSFHNVTSEVWKAVQRDGLHPERTAAEHLNLTPWSKIEELQKPQKSSH